MRVDVFACIFAICRYGLIESHEYSAKYDTDAEYLDDSFHDDEECMVGHRYIFSEFPSSLTGLY